MRLGISLRDHLNSIDADPYTRFEDDGINASVLNDSKVSLTEILCFPCPQLKVNIIIAQNLSHGR